MLSSVEEIVLLQIDNTGKRTEFPLEATDVVLAGAVMMDLALQKHIDSDLNRLFVDDPRPTGGDILDHALSVLAETARDGPVAKFFRPVCELREKAV